MTPRVVLCGTSLSMTALQASLQMAGGLQIASLETELPDVRERLRALAPGAIVLDQGSVGADLVVEILREHPNVPVMSVDFTTSTVTVLSSRTCSIQSVAELAGVLLACTESESRDPPT